MRVGIIGSRQYQKLGQVKEYVRSLDRSVTIVSGDEPGVDTAAAEEAELLGMPGPWIFRPEYGIYGRFLAPFRCYEQIVFASHSVAAFWDGTSRDTQHAIRFALKEHIPMLLFKAGDKQGAVVTCWPSR